MADENHLIDHFLLRIRKGKLTPEEAENFAREAITLFFESYNKDKSFNRNYIDIISEIACHGKDEVEKIGTSCIFKKLIEPLSDSFDPEKAALYDQIMAHIIDNCRRKIDATAVDAKLKDFEMRYPSDFLIRKAKLEHTRSFNTEEIDNLKKVFILSRITIGAEVAINSVIFDKLKKLKHNFEIIHLTSPQAFEIYGSDSQITLSEIRYKRQGNLIDRLLSWLEPVRIIERLTIDLESYEYLIIDPDSRITQLGLLPLEKDVSRYLFFNSRRYRKEGVESLGGLCDGWMNEVFQMTETSYPYLALRPEDLDYARHFCDQLRAAGCQRLICVSFGVGGNLGKRFSQAFEAICISNLVSAGVTVLLDKGSPEEIGRAQSLIDSLKAANLYVTEFDAEANPQPPEITTVPQVIAWKCKLGRFASFIGQSDAYIGYDSSGQHFAAALGIPTLAIFVDDNLPIFVKRWHPYGPGPIHVVRHTDKSESGMKNLLQEIDNIQKKLT